MPPNTISLITAVFNAEKTIGDTLRSSLSQDYEWVERIVIDGGSNDGTMAVVEDFRSRLDRIISEPDRGIYDALNKGIRASTGEVVGFLHADDIFANDSALSKVAGVFTDREVDA